MHILFVALNFHPDRLGNAPIITDLAAGLVRRGHRVSVVCAMPHHETGAIDPAYRGLLWQRDIVQGVQVLRVWVATGERFLLKLANYASFSAIASLAASLIPSPDVIFSPSPPITLGLVDALLARLKGAPFVFNLQDVFPDVAVQLGVLRRPSVIAGFRRIESFTYRHAAKIAVLSPGMAALLERKGVPREKLVIIPNCVDVEGIRPLESSRLRHTLGFGAEQFVVGFAGRIGYSQGLETLIDAAGLLAGEPRIRFLVIGSGAARDDLERQARERGLGNVTFLPTRPREELADALAAADLHLVPLRRGLASYSVPSKLLGVMAAGRPALASLEEDSDAAHLIAEAGCGQVIPPEDAPAMADAIRGYAADPERCRREGQAGRRHLVAHFHPETMIDRYEALFTQVAGRPAKA